MNLIKYYLSGYLLFIVSLILMGISFPIGVFWTFVTFMFKMKFSDFFKRLNQYFYQMAVSVDQLGNVLMQDFFNRIFLTKKTKTPFGSEDETISSVMGKNEKHNTLGRLGKKLNALLDRIDPGHSLNSMEFGKRIGLNKDED